MKIELQQTNGEYKRNLSIDVDQISTYEEVPIYPLVDDETDPVKYKMQTKIVTKQATELYCDLASYTTLKNYFKQKDQYWNL